MCFTPPHCATLRLPAKETKTLKAARARPNFPASPRGLGPDARGRGEPEEGLGLPRRGKEGGQQWQFPSETFAEWQGVLF